MFAFVVVFVKRKLFNDCQCHRHNGNNKTRAFDFILSNTYQTTKLILPLHAIVLTQSRPVRQQL